MPALDINMIESLSRELHPPHTNLMAETEVTTIPSMTTFRSPHCPSFN